MSNEVTTKETKAAKPVKNDKPPKDKKPSVVARITKFFKEIRSEARKVVWPSFESTLNNSIAVIVAIVIVGIFTGALDTLFSLLRNLIIDLI